MKQPTAYILSAAILTKAALGFLSPLRIASTGGLKLVTPTKNPNVLEELSPSIFVTRDGFLEKNDPIRGEFLSLYDSKANYADWQRKWLSDGLGVPSTATAAPIGQITKAGYGSNNSNVALINSVSTIEDNKEAIGMGESVDKDTDNRQQGEVTVAVEAKDEKNGAKEEDNSSVSVGSRFPSFSVNPFAAAGKGNSKGSGGDKAPPPSSLAALAAAAAEGTKDRVEKEAKENENKGDEISEPSTAKAETLAPEPAPTPAPTATATTPTPAPTPAPATAATAATAPPGLLPPSFYASLSSIRHRTDSNSVTVDGTSDTPANKAIWAKEIPPLMAHFHPEEGGKKGVNEGGGEEMKRFVTALERAWESPEDETVCTQAVLQENSDALLGYMEAYMYQVSSLGILQAVRNPGLVSKFTGLCRVIVNHYPTLDQGVGFCYQGGYRLSLPWPFGNKQKACRTFLQALEIDPLSKRNLYYNGVAHYAVGKNKEALEYFEKSLKAECTSPSQEDIKDFLHSSGLEAVAMLKKKLKIK